MLRFRKAAAMEICCREGASAERIIDPREIGSWKESESQA